ncbi:MAG: pyrroloquinoline quinone biosynthesis protein PqqB [Pseudomonadales bacterium]|nr:pyrroloquinoline quinone biosynthesis protein PqqB [Pseudomonadales bacterium]
MYIRVLGSAAGGGFPQWNCNCNNCAGFRNGIINAKARTQSSIAVSSDKINWVLFNASPDILAQLKDFAPLQPARHLRDTGISAIVLMDSQIDHTTGLLMLREGCPHDVYCTDMVLEDLSTGFPLFNMLKFWNGGLQHKEIQLDKNDRTKQGDFTIPAIAGLRFHAVPLTSKAPPYSPHRHDAHIGDNIGMLIEDTASGKTLFYAPGLASPEPHITTLMENADCLLVDGTFWTDDEMSQAGVGTKTAQQMGHLAQTGDDGMIALLKPMQGPRKILIHINNTNPILIEDSPQRAVLERENIEVAFDGMDIIL